MVRLKSCSHDVTLSDGGIAVSRHADLLCRVDQVKIRHELTDGSNHLRGQSPGDPVDRLIVRLIGEEPFPEVADRPAGDLAKYFPVQSVDVDPCDLIFLVGRRRVLVEFSQRHSCENILRCDAFDIRCGRHTGQDISGFMFPGFRHHFFYRIKGKALSGKYRMVSHVPFSSPPFTQIIMSLQLPG